MATVDELIVQIKADTRDLNRKLGELEKNVGKASNSGGMRKLGDSMRSLVPIARRAALAVTALTAAATGTVALAKDFEGLRISLQTVFGGMEAGNQAFDRILVFAEQMPFAIDDIAKAFIGLRSSGFTDFEDELIAFADAASVTLTPLESFNALIRILKRSPAGGLGLEDLNQLDDRGLPVFTILERKLGRTRLQLQEFGKTAEGSAKLFAELIEGLKEDFGGQTGRQMDTVNQKMNNLGDAIKRASLAIFDEGGLGKGTKNVLDNVIETVNQFSLLVKVASTGLPPDFFRAGTNEDRQKVLRDQLNQLRDVPDDQLLTTGRSVGTTKTLMFDRLKQLEQEAQAALDAAEANRIKQEAQAKETAENKATAQAVDEKNKKIKEAQKTTERLTPQTEKLLDQIEFLNSLAKEGDEETLAKILGGVELPEQIQRIRDEIERLQEPLQKTSKLFDEDMRQAIISSSNAFTVDFVNALLEGQSVLDSFANFAKNIVSQIIATFLQLAIVNKILNAVFGLSGTSAALPTGSFSSGGFKVQDNASGGRFQGGRPMLVGERGPELMIPQSGGRVMNNHSSRMAMGGDGVVINQNLNFSTGVVPTVRQEIMKMLPTISDVTKASVLEAASRGGTYRRGLLGG